ncbi:MAG TPA: hypothetical protein VGG30_10835 [Pirellulales bacterium]
MNRHWYVAAVLSLGACWLCAVCPATAQTAGPDVKPVPLSAVSNAAITQPAVPNGTFPQQPCSQCQMQAGGCPWCPNDYCCKALPAIPRTPCQWLCDLYNRKPLPCIPPTPCQWQPNDYCPKPPIAVPRHCEPWYRCVPLRPNQP